MKTIKILLTLLLITFSMSASAQNGGTTLRGDVNEDGVVDVLDVTTLIDIILGNDAAPAPTPKVYFGMIAEKAATTITSIPAGASSTEEKTITINGDGESRTWYFIVPETLEFTMFEGSTEMTSDWVENVSRDRIVEGGITYKVYADERSVGRIPTAYKVTMILK